MKCRNQEVGRIGHERNPHRGNTKFPNRAAYLQWCAERRAARPKWRNVRYHRIKAAEKDRVDPFVVFEQAGWHCCYCKVPTPKELRGTRKKTAPELDHIVPLSRGGEHSYANVQLLCRACNGDKRNLLPHEM